MSSIRTLLSTTGFRRWTYFLVAYVLGYTFGAAFLADYTGRFWAYVLLFFIPANTYFYGMVYYFTENQQTYSGAKNMHDRVLQKRKRKAIAGLTIVSAIVLLFFFLFQTPLERIFSAIFLLVPLIYYLPVLRLKKRPLLDLIISIVYLIPGLVGYVQAAGKLPNKEIALAVLFWIVGMYIFSTIPKISSDKKEKSKTSAIVFGRTGSLWICTVLWMTAAVKLITIAPTTPTTYISLLYPLIAFVLATKNPYGVERIYKQHPRINGLVGILFLITGMLFLS